MKIVALSTLVLAEPVLDENGKSVRVEKLINGVKRTLTLTENIHVAPGDVIDIDKSLALECIGNNTARVADAVLDGDEV
jgi:hypothetical protein